MLKKKFISFETYKKKYSGQEFKINIKKKKAFGVFRVDNFEDHGHQVVYISALNLTGYGDTVPEAQTMLDAILEDYLHGLFTLPEQKIVDTLSALGWKRNPIFKKDFTSSAHVDKEGILRNFNLPSETQIHSQLIAV